MGRRDLEGLDRGSGWFAFWGESEEAYIGGPAIDRYAECGEDEHDSSLVGPEFSAPVRFDFYDCDLVAAQTNEVGPAFGGDEESGLPHGGLENVFGAVGVDF